MYQIYFLTVLINIVAGLTVASPFLSKKISFFTPLAEKMDHKVYRIILGIITLFLGFVVLLSHSPESLAVIGNLIPAISLLSMGTILIIHYFFHGEVESKFVNSIKVFFEKYGNLLGIAGILIGFIHFLFPLAIFL